MAVDPLTATQNAITAFFDFLSTDAGQIACQDFRKIDAAFHGKLKDLFDKLHGNMTAPETPK